MRAALRSGGPWRARRAGAWALALLASGCALISKGEPLTPRYFTPLAEPARATPSAASGQASELRLGRVEPAAYLSERIAYRVSDAELAYYDYRRWTEPPEELVRRALERELFERRGLGRMLSGSAPTLDVEVLGFEELRQQPPRARVSLRVTLRDERRSQLERTVTADAPLGSEADAGTALARAMATALSAAIVQVADAAVEQLRETSEGLNRQGTKSARGAGDWPERPIQAD